MGKKVNQFDEIYSHLQEILAGMKYGSITLVVQDGVVVQIEKNEKLRIK
nr:MULTISPECIES: YezD family protein [Bacillus]